MGSCAQSPWPEAAAIAALAIALVSSEVRHLLARRADCIRRRTRDAATERLLWGQSSEEPRP